MKIEYLRFDKVFALKKIFFFVESIDHETAGLLPPLLVHAQGVVEEVAKENESLHSSLLTNVNELSGSVLFVAQFVELQAEVGNFALDVGSRFQVVVLFEIKTSDVRLVD